MTLSARAALLAFALVGVSATSFAGQLTSQAQLSSILGGNETMEDFEGNGLLGSGQIIGSYLDSTSTFGGFGPGLVKAGASYSSGNLYWNDNGYYNLNTRTLGDASDWRGDATHITYTEPVTAFGFDLAGYAGLPQDGVVDVYDRSNSLISETSVNGGFFGWEDAGGIGSVAIRASSVDQGYIMIDNHGFGSAVPEPAPLALLGLSGAIAMVSRRRKS